MGLRVTGYRHDALTGRTNSDQIVAMYFTKAESRLLGTINPRRRITGLSANYLAVHPKTDQYRATQVYGQVLMAFTPDFSWIEMFMNEVFPYDISFNSIGATRFATDVTMVDSGHDQRISRWDQPLMEYDIAYGVRTMEQLQGLNAFFRAAKGRRNAFLYKDHSDFTSTMAKDVEARKAPDTTPFDQLLGIGDDRTYQFQLLKEYTTPALSYRTRRPIYKPKSGTVKVSVGGSQVSNFQVSTDDGIVTFTPKVNLFNLNDVALRVDPSASARRRITGAPGMFNDIAVGMRIVTSGWVEPTNNTSVNDLITVHSKAADHSWISLTLNAAPTAFGSTPETSVNGVRVYHNPAPLSGQEVRAGFEFYVPVRFDTDRLPVSLEAYGIGGAADVKLIEVRKHEEDL